jgi:hypothetical protein
MVHRPRGSFTLMYCVTYFSKDTEKEIQIKIEKEVTWVMNRGKMGQPVAERGRREKRWWEDWRRAY